MVRRITVIALSFIIAIAFIATPVSAASPKKVKMTTYQVIKSGNKVYCGGAGGVYKVKIKNGRAKKVTRLFKSGAYGYVIDLTKKGNYIYFFEISTSSAGFGRLYRVNIKNGKRKTLASCDGYLGYAIKNNRLYLRNEVSEYYDKKLDEIVSYPNGPKIVTRSMKLNGKSKKKVSVKITTKRKKSNKKGYSLKTKYYNDYKYARDFLKTPKGKFLLGKSIARD